MLDLKAQRRLHSQTCRGLTIMSDQIRCLAGIAYLAGGTEMELFIQLQFADQLLAYKAPVLPD